LNYKITYFCRDSKVVIDIVDKDNNILEQKEHSYKNPISYSYSDYVDINSSLRYIVESGREFTIRYKAISNKFLEKSMSELQIEMSVTMFPKY